MKPATTKPPRRILVIGLRRLGDLLLATALIRTLKAAWPQAAIDVLASAGTEVVLEGNADVSQVLTFTRGKNRLALARRLFRRYDLSVSLQTDDRAQWLALLAAPRRASIVPSKGTPGAGWKSAINTVHTPLDLHVAHVVEQYLRLADVLDIPRQPELVPPRPESDAALDRLLGAGWRQQPRAIIHPVPMYRYKAWTFTGWVAVITHLLERGLQVCVSGGPSDDERAQVAALVAAVASPAGQVVDLSGQLRFAELTPLLESAQVFIGPDTSVTHLAAACKVPTVALFGPSNPSAWGPWPAGWTGDAPSPWVHTGALQQAGNVWLVQGTRERRPRCIPCMREGCENRRDSESDCLEKLAPARVIAAIDTALGGHRTRGIIVQ